MGTIRNHLNAFLVIAGFIMMAGGGAEVARSDVDPLRIQDTTYPAIQDFGPELNLIPALGPLPLIASDPEKPAVNALNPEEAAAEAPEEIDPNYDGQLERYATGNMLRFIEGSFGALVMISAGIGAIVAGAFGAYKAAISLLFVAVGAFILRALVSLFFGTGYDPYAVDLVGGASGGL